MINEILTIPQLWRHLQYSRRQMVDYQNRRLRRVIDHAYRNVPYYRRLFDRAGIKPQDIQTIGDLPKIPITSKADHHSTPPADFVARGIDPDRLIIRTSGGSTGEPVCIRRTWFEERLLNTFRFRARQQMGLRMTDRTAAFALVPSHQTADRQFISRLMHSAGLFRTALLDVLHPAAELLEELERIQPDVITGYAGAIAQVARLMLDQGKTTLRPRLVSTGAEVVTPLMRQQISRAFAAPVYDVYGSNEFNIIASECLKTGQMHVCDDLAVIEIVRDGRPVNQGERGEVVGTSLQSFAMPIIRLSLNDVAMRGAECCPCGTPFSTIRAVQGRMIDYFPLPDGRMLHPFEIFDNVLYDRAEWLQQYQIIQERADLIVLRAVTFRTPSQQRLNEIRAESARLLGPGVEFRIEFLPELKLEPNGKFRVARSLIRSQYDGIDWERVERE